MLLKSSSTTCPALAVLAALLVAQVPGREDKAGKSSGQNMLQTAQKVCSVCGNSVAGEGIRMMRMGKLHYFDSQQCMKRFQENPMQYGDKGYFP